MKKILVAFVALLTIASVSITTAAAGAGSIIGAGTGDTAIDVMASYKPSNDDVGTIYNVDITWESMRFTYIESEKPEWNPDTHTYSDSESGRWEKTEANITVTNHSDSAVNVAIAYIPEGQTGITGTITNGTATLQAGKIGKPEEADSLTATLKISGKPNGTVTEAGVKIGTVTVKIS